MNSAGKLAIFAVSLAAIFGVALAVGAAVGPIDVGGAHVDRTMTTTDTVALDGSGNDMAPMQTGAP